jgi:hypothetical protein
VTATYPESVSQPDRDIADHAFSIRNARWRGWLRVHTPNVLYYRLGLVVPKARDCGNHEWHNSGNGVDACYHCEVTRSTPPDAPWFSDPFNRADDTG